MIHYGICGEGFGHFSRVEFVAPLLLAAGYRLRFFSNGRVLEALRQRFPDCECTPIRGLHFHYRNNTIDLPATAGDWARLFGWWLPEARSSVRRIRADRPCAIISDYEPVLAQSAFYTGTPLIVIDHQQVLSECELDPLPVRSFPLPLARLFNFLMNGFPALRIAVSFYHPPPRRRSPRRNFHLTGPLLREAALRRQARAGEHVLIYQTSQSLQWLDRVLDRLPGEKRVYGADVRPRSGVIPRPRDGEAFLDDLASCRFALVNGGHSTVCEALHFGKPVMCFPVRRQIEQELNALYVEKLGFGKAYWLEKDEVPDFADFLAHEAEFRANIPQRRIPPGHQQVQDLILNFLARQQASAAAETSRVAQPPPAVTAASASVSLGESPNNDPTQSKIIILKSWKKETSALVLDLDGTLHRGRWRAAKGMTNFDLAYNIGWELRPCGLPLPPPLFTLRVLGYALRERLWRGRLGDNAEYYRRAIAGYRNMILEPCPQEVIRAAAERLTAHAWPDLEPALQRLHPRFGKILIASKAFEPVLQVYANYIRNGAEKQISILGNPLQAGDSRHPERAGVCFASGADKAAGVAAWLRDNRIEHCLVVGDTAQDLAMAEAGRELLGEYNCLMIAMHPKSTDFANRADLTCNSWSEFAEFVEQAVV